MYRVAIFDFDGTLVDSAPGIVDVMAQVVKEHDMHPHVLEHWRHLIGVPLLRQMELVFPDKSGDYHLDMASRYRAIYDSKTIEICPPFPGLKGMLDKLHQKDVQMAIISSKRRNLVEVVLNHHELSRYFKIVLGQQDVNNHKPHPEPVHFAIDKLNCAHTDVVVIGDSTFDLDMAKNAGVDAIGVTTGIHTREILQASKPAHIVGCLEHVTPLILNGRMPKNLPAS